MQKRLTDSIRRFRGENARLSAWLTVGLAAAALSIGAVGFGVTLPYSNAPGRTLEPLHDVATPVRVSVVSPSELEWPIAVEPAAGSETQGASPQSGARVALQPTATTGEPAATAISNTSTASTASAEIHPTVSAAGAPGGGVEPLPPPSPSPSPSPRPSPVVANGQAPAGATPTPSAAGVLIPVITNQPTAITPAVPDKPASAGSPPASTEGRGPSQPPATAGGTAPRRPTALPPGTDQGPPEIIVLGPTEAG